jgi:hypothetical protein
VLISKKYWAFPFYTSTDEEKLENWKALVPPPLSEHRLTFAKHKGRLLEVAPHTYMVKFLITCRKKYLIQCPIAGDAVEHYLKRHPEMKSHAGRQEPKSAEDTK